MGAKTTTPMSEEERAAFESLSAQMQVRLDKQKAEIRRLHAELETTQTRLARLIKFLSAVETEEEKAYWESENARIRTEEREVIAALIHRRYEEVGTNVSVEGELLRLEDAVRARKS